VRGRETENFLMNLTNFLLYPEALDSDNLNVMAMAAETVCDIVFILLLGKRDSFAMKLASVSNS
jgi:hypothetical protein